MALTRNAAGIIASRRGDVKVGNGFTGVMRDFDSNGLTVGDEFVIPETYEVYRQKMRGKDSNGNDIYAEYMFVETQNGTKQFFPGMFSKNVIVYEQTKQGEPLKVVRDAQGKVVTEHVTGTAVDKFREAMPDINAGLQLLAKSGKKVKIVASKKVLTRAFGRDALTTSNIYTIDLV